MDWWEPQLGYTYDHYPDRVEVETSVYIRASTERPPTAHVPLVDFVIHNLGSQVIIRLEIDGLALPIAVTAPVDANACDVLRGHLGTNWLAAPLRVRWQAARTVPRWQHATTALPACPPLEPSQGTPKDNAVHLYFHGDGSVTAQRVHTLIRADGKTGMRNTAPELTYTTVPACDTMQRGCPSEFPSHAVARHQRGVPAIDGNVLRAAAARLGRSEGMATQCARMVWWRRRCCAKR